MGLFIVSKLLLMTLLFQLSEENEEWKTGTTPDPDKSVHLREFCLRVPDGSHWTRPPAKSAEPTKPAAPLLEQPTTEPEPTFWDSTQEPDLTDIQDTPDTPDTRDAVVRSVVASGLRGLKTAISGCRCKEREKKPLTEILGFRSIMMWLPSETCASTEYIGTLTTGMEVCGIIPSLLTFVKEQLKSQSVPAAPPSIHEEPAVTPPAPLAPTTELPTTTVSPSLSEVTETDWIYEFEASGTETADECESCNFMTNLDNVDPKSVQSLTVRMQSFPCAVQIFLKDGTDFCLDLNHPEFKTALRKLGFSPPLEPDIARTPKPITSGCRCKESEKKLPAKLSTLTSTRVWPPSETCASTEFIETLMDGREVCVFTPSLSIYLHHLRP
ncbi:uncharacterized protein LOC121626917 [Chelmon rostratus]|uniref:uncharacterized protein LOC121626917 n=1 Tax=Chelmon rostratus TaxID=109905 RepID=UPI001BEB8D48|nr:uncharacterized protein LOC121626917 [Chelmon rostratus]